MVQYRGKKGGIISEDVNNELQLCENVKSRYIFAVCFGVPRTDTQSTMFGINSEIFSAVLRALLLLLFDILPSVGYYIYHRLHIWKKVVFISCY